jgi:LysR family nitrogen assimilation transcriptional regulator
MTAGGDAMELKQIRYFVEVARRGSINKAAKALNVAQPAVTRQLQALEEEFAAQLLIRTRRGVKLTDAGERMLRHGQTVLADVLQLHEAIVETKASLTGTVRLGFVPTIAFTLAPILLEESNLRYPGVRLHIVEAARLTVKDWLIDDVIDIALMQELDGVDELRQRYVAEEDLVLVGSKEALDRFGGSITWRALATVPLIMTPGLEEFVQQWADEQYVRLDVVHSVNSIHAIMQTLKGGKFASVIPYSVVSERDDLASLRALPLADPPITRRLVTAYNATRPLSPPMLAVHNLLADAVRRVRLRVAGGGRME